MKLKHYITDEKTGIGYTLCGDYYLPDFSLDSGPKEEPIGVWGRRHGKYLKKHQRHVYDEFFFNGRLNVHLAQIDADAQEMFVNLVKAMAKTEGITEQLKAEDPMRWTGLMNNIRNCAEEIVNRELIFT